MENVPAINLSEIEARMLKMPQAECPLKHHFGPGVYIRELYMPAGIIAIGHKQKLPHINNFIKGRVLMLEPDGSKVEIAAPMCFVGEPGRKVGYVLEDVVWQNIYATDETDIDKLEEFYLDKSKQSLAHQAAGLLPAPELEEDYKLVLEEMGLTEEQVQLEVQNKEDQIPMPEGWDTTCVRNSYLNGKGFFATCPFRPGEIIAPARIGDKRTPAGRYTNHSPWPNAKMVQLGEDIVLVAEKAISGAMGGGPGEEITVNYRDASQFRGRELCQE